MDMGLLQADQNHSQIRTILDGYIEKRDFLGPGGHRTLRGLICLFRIADFNLFTNAPVAGGTRTAEVRKDAGSHIRKFQRGKVL